LILTRTEGNPSHLRDPLVSEAEGVMSPEDFVMPICVAAVFALVGYGILNADRRHAEDFKDALLSMLVFGFAIATLLSLAALVPPPEGGRDRTARVIIKAPGLDGAVDTEAYEVRARTDGGVHTAAPSPLAGRGAASSR
jgi:hypothetical protein